MKYVYFSILTLAFSCIVSASTDDFIMTIKTNGYGKSNFKQFNIPTNPSETYNYSVDCDNDGTIEASGITSDYTCNYNLYGQYVIRIIHDVTTGEGFPSILFGEGLTDADKLISIDQWGTGKWTNMRSAFGNTYRLYIIASDTPDFSNVQDMSRMFLGSKRYNLNTTNWDVSNVSNMSDMFILNEGTQTTTPDLSLWNTSSVTNMSGMFGNNPEVSDISQWNTSNVTNMHSMFGSVKFVPDISLWDVSQVADLSGIFFNAENIPDISLWNTSSVTTMEGMFAQTSDMILNLQNWNTSNVVSMRNMFTNSENIIVHSTNWDTSSLIFFKEMFLNSNNIQIDTGNWDTSSVQNMDSMFAKASNINVNTVNWQLPKVTSMKSFLNKSEQINIDISQWQLPSIHNLQNAFSQMILKSNQYESFLMNLAQYSLNNATILSAEYSQFCSPSAENSRSDLLNNGWSIYDAGKYCDGNSDDFIITIRGDTFEIVVNSIYTYDFDVDCDNDGIYEALSQNQSFTCDYSMSGGFGDHVIAIKHNGIDGFPAFQLGSNTQNRNKLKLLNHWGTSHWQSMNSAFSDMSGFYDVSTDIPDTSEVIDFSYMFYKTFLKSLNVSQWDVSSAITIKSMFENTCLTQLDTAFWNTSLIQDMSNAFSYINNDNFSLCPYISPLRTRSISLDVSAWDTSSVTSMEGMFQRSPIDNLDVSQWNTSNVLNMDNIFKFTNTDNIDVSSWNTAKVTSMNSMFSSAKMSNLNVSQWDTSLVTSMNSMFSGVKIPNLDFSLWNTSLTTDMEDMFAGSKIQTIEFGNWDISEVLSMDRMLKYTSLPTSTYDDLLVDFVSQPVQQGVLLDAGDSFYCSQAAITARNILISSYNWIITDLGKDCSTAHDFIIKVKTDNIGTSTDTQFTIPINPNVMGYNYSVDCDNDGVLEAEMLHDNYTCNYSEIGVFEIRIIHDPITRLGFPAIYFNNIGDSHKLLSIEQWGDGIWTSFFNAFYGVINLQIDSQDNPDFTQVESFTDVFNGVSLPFNIYEDLLIHLKSTVSMPNLVFHAGNSNYCSPASRVSRGFLVEQLSWSVVDTGMQCFRAPSSDFVFTYKEINPYVQLLFNNTQIQSPYDYNVDCNNDGVFEYLNQTDPIINCDYNEITESKTIRIAHNLNNDNGFPFIGIGSNLISINQWGSGKWESMSGFFSQTADVWVDDVAPITSELVSMSYMFRSANNIHIDVSNWDVSSVTNMSNMFASSSNFSLDTSGWITSSLIDMSYMFRSASVDVDVYNWDTSQVMYMQNLFSSASNINYNISQWDISNVINMDNIFGGLVLSTELYDDILINFGSQNVNSNLVLEVPNTNYCSLEAIQARENLVNNYNWTIIDNGYCGFVFRNGFE